MKTTLLKKIKMGCFLNRRYIVIEEQHPTVKAEFTTAILNIEFHFLMRKSSVEFNRDDYQNFSRTFKIVRLP